MEDIERKRAADLVLEDGRPFHDALLTARGWPEIPFDGRLLVTQQDALLMGGKVQAMPGFADHVVFRDLRLCAACDEKTCIAMCSGQAITLGANNLPVFEREKCIHCGGCVWNCAKSADGEHTNLEFRAGAGGLAFRGELKTQPARKLRSYVYATTSSSAPGLCLIRCRLLEPSHWAESARTEERNGPARQSSIRGPPALSMKPRILPQKILAAKCGWFRSAPRPSCNK